MSYFLSDTEASSSLFLFSLFFSFFFFFFSFLSSFPSVLLPNWNASSYLSVCMFTFFLPPPSAAWCLVLGVEAVLGHLVDLSGDGADAVPHGSAEPDGDWPRAARRRGVLSKRSGSPGPRGASSRRRGHRCCQYSHLAMRPACQGRLNRRQLRVLRRKKRLKPVLIAL